VGLQAMDFELVAFLSHIKPSTLELINKSNLILFLIFRCVIFDIYHHL